MVSQPDSASCPGRGLTRRPRVDYRWLMVAGCTSTFAGWPLMRPEAIVRPLEPACLPHRAPLN